MADQAEGTGTHGSWGRILWSLIAVVILAGSVYFGFRGWNGNRHAKPAIVEPPVVRSTLSLDPFLVNLADPQDPRFVKVTFQLGITEDTEEFTRNPVAVAATRDAIITLLSSKTSEELLTAEGKNKLRHEVRDRVNTVVAGSRARVLDVYIVEFVVQL